MNLKLIAILGAILLIVAVATGVYIKMTQSSESQKARQIVNYTFEPHQTFGCARYIAPSSDKK